MQKLCSRLLLTAVVILLAKTAKSHFVPPFGDLGVMYTVHLWLVGRRVVHFLLVLIECPPMTLGVRKLESLGYRRALFA